ncbi:MAG: NAD(P)-dependent oxidoreductase [Bacteroidota bacterium]|nr:NAD(P)-dependent oxidoreductase [Bacteroidota bacterium]
MKPTLGFVGLGLMGTPMATRLLNAGYPLRIYNRTKEKASSLIERGAKWCDFPAAVAQQAEIVFSMLTNDDALKSVASVIQTSIRSGGIHVDCSTVSPTLTSFLENKYSSTGRYFLHSPVLGSIPNATDGSLLLFVGGNSEAFVRVEPLLNILGSKMWRFPKAEQASNMKLIMNSFIAGMIATLSQALAFAQKAGVTGTTVLDVLHHSALNSSMYQTKGKSILEGNFSPRFFLDNLLKDTNLFRDAAQMYSVSTPIAESVKELLEEAVSRGLGKEDYSAVSKVVR